MAEHTPGPWRIEYDEDESATMLYGPGIERLAELLSVNDADDALIAAAPDLLRALLLIREWIDGIGGPLPLGPIDAAIAKATGEDR